MPLGEKKHPRPLAFLFPCVEQLELESHICCPSAVSASCMVFSLHKRLSQQWPPHTLSLQLWVRHWVEEWMDGRKDEGMNRRNALNCRAELFDCSAFQIASRPSNAT